MATASSLVFGITELFEQILEVNVISYRHLFVMQRVNKSFRKIIQDSTILKRKMRLLDPKITPGSVTLADSFPLLTHIRMRAWLEMRPIQYEGLELKDNRRSKVHGTSRDKKQDMFVTPRTLVFSVGCGGKMEPPLDGMDIPGIKSKKTYRICGLDSSWSNMLLTGHRMACRIKVEVTFVAWMVRVGHNQERRPMFWERGIKHEYHYYEDLELGLEQTYTLGDLFDFLKGIRARSTAAHIARKHSYGCSCLYVRRSRSTELEQASLWGV